MAPGAGGAPGAGAGAGAGGVPPGASVIQVCGKRARGVEGDAVM